MTPETQLQLLDRIMAHRVTGRGTDVAPSSLSVPTSAYTDPHRLEVERRLMLRQPTVVGLSGLVPTANSYATVEIAGRSIIVTRDDGGVVHALLNVCSHRGAELTHECGRASRLACPYHGWTYHLDGDLAARRRGEYFDDVPRAGLTAVPIRETAGLLWVSATPGVQIAEQPLAGAESEIVPFELGTFKLFGTRRFSRPLNWKLAVDTFAESYHVAILHRETLAPMIHSDYALFDPFGPHGRMIATRRSIADLYDQSRDGWGLAPHATILYFLQPNTVLIYQQDHVQLYRSEPGSHPGEANLTVSVYVPHDSPKPESYWQRNFDLLVDVTDGEDFTTAAGIQRGYESGAKDTVVFGRNEPALQHFHTQLDALLAALPTTVS